MSADFAVVFCSDQRGLPGLHVAAYSLLHSMSPEGPTRICVFSDSLTKGNVFGRETLTNAGGAFSLELWAVDPAIFHDFPAMQGSWAAYYRLYAAQILNADRIVYVDVDTLCDVDISPLKSLPMQQYPAAWIAEVPLSRAVDRRVAEQLGTRKHNPTLTPV